MSDEETDPLNPSKVKHRSKLVGDVPKMAFKRIIQDIIATINPELRIQTEASDALQEATESMLIHRFARCHQLTDLCKMDTLRSEHWNFVSSETTVTQHM